METIQQHELDARRRWPDDIYGAFVAMAEKHGGVGFGTFYVREVWLPSGESMVVNSIPGAVGAFPCCAIGIAERCDRERGWRRPTLQLGPVAAWLAHSAINPNDSDLAVKQILAARWHRAGDPIFEVGERVPVQEWLDHFGITKALR
jgi:hypothetical protein